MTFRLLSATIDFKALTTSCIARVASRDGKFNP